MFNSGYSYNHDSHHEKPGQGTAHTQARAKKQEKPSRTPNATTVAAMGACERGEFAGKFTSVKDMMDFAINMKEND